MVDLHDSLRPNETAAPLPVSEIAARAKRRERRRLVSTTGLTVATLAIAAFAISSIAGSTPDSVTVADGADVESGENLADETSLGDPDETTSQSESQSEGSAAESEPEDAERSTTPSPTPADGTAGGETADTADAQDGTVDDDGSSDGSPEDSDSENAADGMEPADAEPQTTPGIQTTITTTSQWDDGYCIQVEATNDGTGQDAWQIVLDLDGTIDTLWNATAVEASTGTFVFSGLEGYNTTIRPGAVTSFGTCVDSNIG